jgi:hypothetical protein
MIIRVQELPATIYGVTIKDNNGDYNVYINSCITEDARAEAFRHEVRHIREGHFYMIDDVRAIEAIFGIRK